MDGSTTYTWVPPEFNLSGSPPFTESWSIRSDSSLPGNFARSAKWCPDGSVALVQCEHREFRILTPKTAELQNEASSSNSNPKPEALMRALPQPAPILDYAWYPSASSADPASFCFVASVRETPVKLLDASDGRLRASYSIVDHRERQIAPHSLAFNLSATKLYCGFEDAIEMFDVGRPGEGTRLPTSPSKKSRDGLKGIISALAFSPSYETDMYAAGSLAATPGNIVLFSETDGTVPVSFISGGPAAGVTQLHFNPMRPHILYAAFRRRREIYSWDLRADVGAPLAVYSPAPTTTSTRAEETNQKRLFGVDIAGRFLGVGDQEGNINIFDLSTSVEEVESLETLNIIPRLTWRAHEDAIGGVSFHPTRATLLSVSGSRNFHATEREEEEDSSSDEDSEDTRGRDVVQNVVRRSAARPTPVPLDSFPSTSVFRLHCTSTMVQNGSDKQSINSSSGSLDTATLTEEELKAKVLKLHKKIKKYDRALKKGEMAKAKRLAREIEEDTREIAACHSDPAERAEWMKKADKFANAWDTDKEYMLLDIGKGLGLIVASPFMLAGGVLYGVGLLTKGLGNLLTGGTIGRALK
ncbi:Telomerase Cajal body protein 1 [Mycena venus]|uniref:Telomerase Cajal body protein 1 n=1 Tax=Mycena venus TaxID=2733690 RepID=A0A8H7DAT9_9AGAR|nr:Telomerase Cajal body protein 1 [Mycena venus]